MALLDDALDEDIRAEKILAVLDKEEQAAAAAPPAAQAAQAQETPQQNSAEQAVETGAQETAPTVTEENGQGEPEPPAIEPPKFLKADMRDKWKSLPTDWQSYLARQEEENSRTVSTKLDEAAAIRRQAEVLQRAADEQRSKAAQEQQRYAQQLGTIVKTFETLDPVISTYNRLQASGELVKLAREQPAQYAELDAAYKGRMQTLTQFQTEQTRVQSELMREHFAREEKALVEKMPDWTDQDTGSKAMTRLREGAVRLYGYRPEEVRLIHDHRLVLMARDALAYHELKAELEAKEKASAEEKAKAAAALAAKRTPPQTKTVTPNAQTENAEKAATERNKAILKQARGRRSLEDKASLIAQLT